MIKKNTNKTEETASLYRVSHGFQNLLNFSSSQASTSQTVSGQQSGTSTCTEATHYLRHGFLSSLFVCSSARQQDYGTSTGLVFMKVGGRV